MFCFFLQLIALAQLVVFTLIIYSYLYMKINVQMTNPFDSGYAKKVTEFIERSPISDGKFGTFPRIGSFEQ